MDRTIREGVSGCELRNGKSNAIAIYSQEGIYF